MIFLFTDVYNISNNRGRVCRLTLFKNNFRLGEDVLGTIDFDHTDVPCIQFTVTLQSEELLNSNYRRKSSQLSNLTSFTKQSEFCLSTSQTYLSLSIPLSCTPSFSMDLGKNFSSASFNKKFSSIQFHYDGNYILNLLYQKLRVILYQQILIHHRVQHGQQQIQLMLKA